MISKIGVGILTVAALLLAAPSSVFAANSTSANNKKIQKYFTDLKKLPNGNAPVSKVTSLVKKLAQLDPKKANVYYKTGLSKLKVTAANKTQASSLAKTVTATVKKAGLPAGKVKAIEGSINKDLQKFISKPIVTGTAMLMFGTAAPVIA